MKSLHQFMAEKNLDLAARLEKIIAQVLDEGGLVAPAD
jgi:hypothetical protein